MHNLIGIPDPDLMVESGFTDKVLGTVNDLLETAQKLLVEDESGFNYCTYLYSKAREWRKVVDEKRKKLAEPSRRQTSQINDHAKLITEPLDKVIALCNEKTGAYVQAIEKKQAEVIWAIELLDGGAIQYPTKIEPINGHGVNISVKKVTSYRVIDQSLIPAEYLKTDDDKIKLHVSLGVSEIPGIEVYEETKTHLRKK